TIVAEYAIARALAAGDKTFYTTPLKALSNQKYGDFVRAYGADRVGLLTGDNAINGDAPIVVMTTEVLRNMIYARSPSLRGLRYVVLDEVHYLQDPSRGAVWEEVIIHLPSEIDLVALSATVSNAEEVASWMQTVRGATDAVIEERRPVERGLAAGLRLTDSSERRALRRIAEQYVESLTDDDLDVLGYDTWLAGMEAGIAAHHAGMVPPMKEAVEEAFAAGLLKVVFATETLSLGINMPARSVVIERLSKFTGEHHQFLTPGEYTQLAGRAGRRGIDDLGYVVVLWDPFVPFEQVAGLASRRTYALASSFRPTYNMTANLVQRYPPDEARHLLNLSFAQYQADRDVVAVERELERRREQL